MNSNELKKLREDLIDLKRKNEVVLFGSHVEGGVRPISDIDVAVLSLDKDRDKNLKLQKELLGKFPLKYDIHVFELFPIYIQISIVENYLVLFGDLLDISEYFYKYRKRWDDCKYRILSNQFSSNKERLSLLK
ncbi:hypothetical protein LCGC14_1070340 [marine sediment metagenome]|uniref:Polymerase nucleotidyl transferase domain-containing protein n=1 Tax=marine sediment metagenome TaxID=412755 RepID=A0A0F9MIH6_9ZZZZ